MGGIEMLRRQRVPQTMLLREDSLGAGVTFRINDQASLAVEGGNLANEIVKTSMDGYLDVHKSIRSWFVANRRMNVSLRLSF
jgi:hypothetical protein